VGLGCRGHRGTSLIRNSPPPQGFHRALGIVLLWGPRRGAVSYGRGTLVVRGEGEGSRLDREVGSCFWISFFGFRVSGVTSLGVV
jgi:hypothetical protein